MAIRRPSIATSSGPSNRMSTVARVSSALSMCVQSGPQDAASPAISRIEIGPRKSFKLQPTGVALEPMRRSGDDARHVRPDARYRGRWGRKAATAGAVAIVLVVFELVSPAFGGPRRHPAERSG